MVQGAGRTTHPDTVPQPLHPEALGQALGEVLGGDGTTCTHPYLGRSVHRVVLHYPQALGILHLTEVLSQRNQTLREDRGLTGNLHRQSC